MLAATTSSRLSTTRDTNTVDAEAKLMNPLRRIPVIASRRK